MRSITVPPTTRRTATGVIITALLGVLLVLAPVPPASATGGSTWDCDNGQWNSFYMGYSKAGSDTYATTSDIGSDCGSLKVKESYRIYPGGPVYWTGWVAGEGFVRVDPGNIGATGAHWASGVVGGPYTHYT